MSRPSTASESSPRSARGGEGGGGQADDLMKQAEKKLSRGAFASIFAGGNKHEEAVELFLKAAALYKVGKKWSEAGDAYARAGEVCEKNLKEVNDACTHYVSAARSYKQISGKASMKYFQIAVDLYMESNRFSTAAKLWKEIAELAEKELDIDQAITAYQKAADCFDAEDSAVNSSSCLVKVAQLSAELDKLQKAIEIYERVSRKALEGSSAARWSVKDYLFKALLCQFVIAARKHDMAPLEAALEQYKDMLPQLDGTRECKLIEDLKEAFAAEEVDQFSDHVFRYDEIYKLDNWTAKVLLSVKKELQSGPKQDDNDFV